VFERLNHVLDVSEAAKQPLELFLFLLQLVGGGGLKGLEPFDLLLGLTCHDQQLLHVGFDGVDLIQVLGHLVVAPILLPNRDKEVFTLKLIIHLQEI